jgi:hypothetical protein
VRNASAGKAAALASDSRYRHQPPSRAKPLAAQAPAIDIDLANLDLYEDAEFYEWLSNRKQRDLDA